jgi:hypothetical protein
VEKTVLSSKAKQSFFHPFWGQGMICWSSPVSEQVIAIIFKDCPQ